MKSIVGVIPARGGSKGLPGKNIKPFAGKPLIVWTIEAALQSGLIDRLIVSTDDPAIAAVVRQSGVDVPSLRPAALARDETSALDVALHILDGLEREKALPECLMWLQPTSPLRTSQDIREGTALMEKSGAPAVLGVCKAKVHPFHVLQTRADGTLEVFLPNPSHEARRQDLSELYQLNGAFYLNRVDSLRTDRTFLPPGSRPFIMPAERSIDIDTAWDFVLAETAMRRTLGSL